MVVKHSIYLVLLRQSVINEMFGEIVECFNISPVVRIHIEETIGQARRYKGQFTRVINCAVIWSTRCRVMPRCTNRDKKPSENEYTVSCDVDVSE